MDARKGTFRVALRIAAMALVLAGGLASAETVFHDSFDTDTSSGYAPSPQLGNPNWMFMSYAGQQKALRFSGICQDFWYPTKLSGIYDGVASVDVTFETLGTPDANSNGLGASVGLRVDPNGAWAHWGVWGGLFTFYGQQYAIINDGSPDSSQVTHTPYPYYQGVTYHIELQLYGPDAVLYINGQKVLEVTGMTQPSSGMGTTAIWVSDGASGSSPSSFLVDNWQVDNGLGGTQLTFTSDFLTPNPAPPNAGVSITGTGGQVCGAAASEIVKVVLGFRDGSGNWVGGEPKVVWTGLPGTSLQNWTGNAVSIAAPGNSGTYGVWAHEAPAVDDGAAIADFKLYKPTADGSRDRKGPTYLLLRAVFI